MSIGERIKKLRIKRGWSQPDLAAACGWTNEKYCGKKKYDTAQIRISRYECNVHRPSIEQLISLAKALKVSVKYLAMGTTSNQSKKD